MTAFPSGRGWFNFSSFRLYLTVYLMRIKRDAYMRKSYQRPCLSPSFCGGTRDPTLILMISPFLHTLHSPVTQ